MQKCMVLFSCNNANEENSETSGSESDTESTPTEKETEKEKEGKQAMTRQFIEGNVYDPSVYPADKDHWEEGEYTVYRTTQWTAPGCHDGCGILVYVGKDGKVAKVEGDPNNAYNRGALCMRCLDLVECMYHEDRLKYPMKRAKEDRGKDKWERITWDEAIDICCDKINEMKEKYGAASAEEIRETVERDIDRLNSDMPKYKHIHRLILQTEEMAKTTTGKVKRYEENKGGN